MNYRLLFKTVGLLLLVLGSSMLLPLAAGIYYSDAGTRALAISVSATLISGVLLVFFFRQAGLDLRSRGAFLVVTVFWLAAIVFGALPYYLSAEFDSIVDALFESASGFTTTGATILTDVEALPPSIVLWRSITGFLGGMGMIVLSLAILPMLGVGGMELYRAEAPGPTSTKISARVKETARALWIIYVVLTSVLTLVLWLSGMGFFDALNHGLTTMATCGFSSRNQGIAAFNSPLIEWILVLFMFLGGVNFVLHYRLFINRDLSIFKDSEFAFYSSFLGVSVAVFVAVLWGSEYSSFFEALRHSAFQVVSITTSTGFSSADYLTWAVTLQIILLIAMVIGGCAGSTSGGMKCVRALLLLKQALREVRRVIHPRAVLSIKLRRAPVAESVVSAVSGFFCLYVLIALVGTLIVAGLGLDLVTAFSSVLACLSNIGPGLGEIGPLYNYSSLPDTVKLVLSFCMIVGRLELMTVLVLFTKDYWRG